MSLGLISNEFPQYPHITIIFGLLFGKNRMIVGQRRPRPKFVEIIPQRRSRRTDSTIGLHISALSRADAQ